MSMSRFRLQQHLPHLLRRAHFESDALFGRIYDDTLTSRQLALLVAVHQRPGASQSQVAQDIGLDLNTCSDLVVRTVAKGLLRRERSTVDARSFCLRLTDEGSQLLLDGAAKANAYQRLVASRLSKTERDQLITLLRKLLGFEG